jgi:hypothetical protein
MSGFNSLPHPKLPSPVEHNPQNPHRFKSTQTVMVSPHPLHNSEPRAVAIVTGSSQGLGLAIALRLADDGCDVVINDLPPKLSAMEDAVRRIALKGVRAVAVVADVSREDEVKKLIETTVGKLGKLDIVRLFFSSCSAS